MLTKRIIASLVGGIILFAWQASSWMFLGIHDNDYKYHPEQAAIMDFLSTHFKENGAYLLPSAPPGTSMEENQRLMKEGVGKPSAIITYKTTVDGDMAMPMIRGYLVYFVLVYLLLYILTRGGSFPTSFGIFYASVAAGFFSWMWGSYTGYIWNQVDWNVTYGLLIDSIVAWALCGIWLAFYFRKRRA